jgi:acetylornithine deacetylase/succinyl-diaminopimelate desuccinylase-like protein
MLAAWGVEASYAATGGSIPLVNALHQAVPEAEILLLGTTDGYANIHAPNERVLIEELEKATMVEAEFFGRFAAAAVAKGNA